MSDTTINDLKKRFISKMKHGRNLLQTLDSLDGVTGISKLKKKVRQELAFLNKVFNSSLIKNEYLLSTNLHHFDALVSCIIQSPNVVSVLETMSYKNQNDEKQKLCIDIICENGRKWIKVVARNPKALSQILSGDGEYGQKSIVDHGIDYVECAKQNQYMFLPPEVYFYFSSGITKALLSSLKKIDVNVIGNNIEEIDGHLEETTSSSLENELYVECKTPRYFNHKDFFTNNNCNTTESNLRNIEIDLPVVNLDVSSMLAYVSALTNGGCNWNFKQPLLNQQAAWERKRPVKPILDNLFLGKTLICCETAYNSLREIVSVIGGPSERERTENLLSQVKVVPDVKYTGIKSGGRIKPRSLIIFGTGHHHRAVTVTANEGFVRAAKHLGVAFAVYVHESRALTEIKQESLLE